MSYTVSYPEPEILSVEYPEIIELGEKVHITVHSRNNGGESPQAYLSLSFPTNPSYVQVMSSNAKNARVYWSGETLWGGYGQYQLTATYPIAEAWETPWAAGLQRNLAVDVKPQIEGTFEFYVKMTTQYEEDIWFADPKTDGSESTYLDQQDEYSYRYTINVRSSAHPVPTIVSVNYPTSINLVNWAGITVTSKNDGTTAEWQTIHISFPDNPALDKIEIDSHDLNGGAKIYPPGTELPAAYGEYTIISEYVMVEGVHGSWESQEIHTMTAKVKPENTGTFTFYVKTVNRAEGITYYDPTPGTKDQQDEYVYVYEIDVQPTHMDLVEKYCPYFIFDEQEEYFPTSFFHDDTDITNNPNNYDKTWPYYLYVHTTEGTWGWSGKEKDYLCIEYWLYYAKDNKFGGWENSLIGAHDHDWESVYVFLKKEGNEYIPDYVAYFHHAWFKDGLIGADLEELYDMYKWIPDSNFPERKDGSHPVVHVARGSHASYWRTIFGWASYKVTTILPNIPPDLIELWIFEPCDGGPELCYDDFQIIYVDEPDPDWPEKFCDIQAPWSRTRWDDPSDMLKIIVKLGYTTSGMSEQGSKLYMHVYDNDRHVGFNEKTSEVETEIPGSYYEDLGNTTFILMPENVTDFEVTVDGKHAHEPVETYELLVSTIRDGEVVEEVIPGTITKDKEKKYAVSLKDGSIEIEELELPDFTIGITPDTKTLKQGEAFNFTVTVRSLHGFNSAVDLNITGLPEGLLCVFDPEMVTPSPNGSEDSILTIAVGSTVNPGDYNATITATSGSTMHLYCEHISLKIVSAPANYSLHVVLVVSVVALGVVIAAARWKRVRSNRKNGEFAGDISTITSIFRFLRKSNCSHCK